MTNLFILTSPRPTERPFEYLEDLVAEIDDEQLPDDVRKTIVCDGAAGDVDKILEVLRRTQSDAGAWHLELFEKPTGSYLGGNKAAYWRVLERARLVGGDSLVLEDDLQSCRNATTRALLFPIPSDVDLLQFYSGFSIRHARTDAGLWRSPATFAGCQAVKFPHRTLVRLCAWASDPEFNKFVASDQAVGLARNRLGLRLAHHVPDLYQHEGRRSAVDAGTALEAGITDELPREQLNVETGRSSATWPGPEFDALRLFACHERFK